MKLFILCLLPLYLFANHVRIDDSYGNWKFEADRDYNSREWVNLNIPSGFTGGPVAHHLSLQLARTNYPGIATYHHGRIAELLDHDIKAYDHDGNYIGFIRISGTNIRQVWPMFTKF